MSVRERNDDERHRRVNQHVEWEKEHVSALGISYLSSRALRLNKEELSCGENE